MSIATIYTPPFTPDDFVRWSFAHMAHHRDINRVIFETASVRLDEYVLDPFNPKDMGNWPWQHQAMHDQMNAQLGIAGYDITEVDWENEDRMRTWLATHGNMHYQAGAILQLG